MAKVMTIKMDNTLQSSAGQNHQSSKMLSQMQFLDIKGLLKIKEHSKSEMSKHGLYLYCAWQKQIAWTVQLFLKCSLLIFS